MSWSDCVVTMMNFGWQDYIQFAMYGITVTALIVTGVFGIVAAIGFGMWLDKRSRTW